MIAPLGFLGLFFLFPLWAILRLSFAEGLEGAWMALGHGYYWRVLGFTLGQALLSTLLTMFVALPGAYIFAHYHFPGKRMLRAVATVPFVLPTIVVAVAFAALLGPKGLLAPLLVALGLPTLHLGSGLGLVLLAHVFYNYSVVLRIVGGFWQHLDPRLGAAATMLGAKRHQVLLRVTMPLLLPALGAAALLIFIFTFTSFGVIVILGGARMATLEVEIYRQTMHLLRLDVAATLALIQAACTLLLSVVYTRLAARVAVPLELQARQVAARPVRSLAAKLLVGGNSAFMLIFLGMPLFALVLRSLLAPPDSPWPLTLAAYQSLNANRTGSAFFVPPTVAMFNSLRIAASTTILALSIGVPSAYLLARRPTQFPALPMLLDALFMLPLGISAVTLGLGYLIALNQLGLGFLRASPWLLPLLHSLVALPFVIRSLLPVLRSRSPHQREAALLLGATPVSAWLRVELPQIAPALATGAVFAFTVSLGEFGASLMLARPDQPTMPVMIFRFLGQPGALNYGQALAMSSILMLTCAVAFVLLERMRPLGGEF
ncbi:MAG: iron ABC transporter permease [Candidatus Viridilinea halotolerans]|uniref:Iron ABC transporter permease n=1 Tax=Candidatus Viridilinea halotolerans TaxID=2491704 RepID=A0A426U3G9_9CHLR|nr:MAG: iron ABC transporter permease [Candidatus Viridilinea halotolerans]